MKCKKVWIISFLALMSLMFAQCKYNSEAPNNSPVKNKNELYNELKQQCENLRTLPGFRKRESSHLIRAGSGVYSIIYGSTANSGEVKSFYSKELIPQGWHLSEATAFNIFNQYTTRKLLFSKGEYEIRITFEAEDAPRDEWEVYVECSWAKGR